MKTRVISGSVVFAIMGLLFLLGGPLFLIALLLLSLGGLYELYVTLSRSRKTANGGTVQDHEPYLYLLFGITGFMYLWMLFWPNGFWQNRGIPICMVLAILIFMGASIHYYPMRSVSDAFVSLFMLIYVPVLLLFAYAIRIRPGGAYLIWYVMAASWGQDTLAYFAGRFLGRQKLIPNVSPNKTLEGAAGGILGAVILCVVYGLIIAEPLEQASGKVMLCSILIGLFGSIAAILGDLFASCIKRSKRVKDFSNLIPGHGGIMDRFDSFIAVTPVVYILVDLFLQ